MLKLTGTLEWVDISGGFYRLKSDSGSTVQLDLSSYVLAGTPAHGIRVQVEGTQEQSLGIAMMGDPTFTVSKLVPIP